MMRNFVSVDPHRVLKHITKADYLNYCGMLRSPRQPSYLQKANEIGAKWACDNDVFSGYAPKRIKRFIEQYQPFARTCVFFNSPDVLLDAVGTMARFDEWEPVLHKLGWPVAFTLQNGMERLKIPFGRIEALFIGASDDWRYGSHAQYVIEQIRIARSRGLWVHVGRVATIKNIKYWNAVGIDSFDSTGYTIEPAKVKRHLPYHKSGSKQPMLFDLNSIEGRFSNLP